MKLIRKIFCAGTCLLGLMTPIQLVAEQLLSSEQRGELTTAHAALVDGEFERALELLNPLYKNHPDNTEIANNFAVALFNTGQHTEAGLVLQEFLVSSDEVGTLSKNLFSLYDYMAAQSYEMLTGNKPEQPTLAVSSPASDRDIAALNQTTTELPASEKNEGTQPVVILNTSDENAKTTSDISTTLKNYISAWSEGDIDAYLGHYYPERSPIRGSSFSTWQKDRRQKVLTSRKISISVDDLQIMQIDESQAIAVYRQTYEARNYSDVTTKQLTWLKRDGEWYIRHEMSLPN